MRALQAAGLDAIGTARTPAAGIVPMDVREVGAVRRFFRTCPDAPDTVVHLAAAAHPRGRSIEPAEFDRVNHVGWRNVLSEGRAAGAQRFVFFSSAVVYGDAGREISETAPRRPIGPYATSKRDAEDVAFRAIDDGAWVAVLRFPVIYASEALDDVRVRAYVPGTSNRLLLGIAGAEPVFSLCAVQNAASAALHALTGGLSAGAYNVADVNVYRQADVRRAVASVDDIRWTMHVSAGLVGRVIRVLSAAAPFGLRDTLQANYEKMFVGLTLDTSRIAASGFTPTSSLTEVGR
jgi:nucleoside-diphosphate-sugar epimerase